MPANDYFTDQVYLDLRNRLGADISNRVTDNPVGESVYDRLEIAPNAGVASSTTLQLSGFTALVSQNITQVRVVTGTTAAAATPTICRLGVYQRDQSTNLHTLVASTVNDTTLFAAASTTYTRPFSAAFNKVAGVDYLVGLLIVTGVALPTFVGPNASGNSAFGTDVQLAFPCVAGRVTGQADLPASFAGASITTGSTPFHALLLQ